MACWLACNLGSLIRDRTDVICIGRRILNHWSTREVPTYFGLKDMSWVRFPLLCMFVGYFQKWTPEPLQFNKSSNREPPGCFEESLPKWGKNLHIISAQIQTIAALPVPPMVWHGTVLLAMDMASTLGLFLNTTTRKASEQEKTPQLQKVSSLGQNEKTLAT